MSEERSGRPARPGDAADLAGAVAAVREARAEGRLLHLDTSGTSGSPRTVVRTTESWWASFDAVAALTGLERGSRLWVAPPPPPPAPVPTLALFAATLADALGAHRVDDLRGATHAHLTPTTLRRLLDAGAVPRGAVLTLAGEVLDPALRDRALDAGARVTHYYGAAELSFVAWGDDASSLTAFPGVEVDVRDGEVWARSPYLAEGYADPAAPGGLRRQGGPLRRDSDGFATVGDRGHRDGVRLVVEGRGDDAVTTGGATVLVADVEAALRPAAPAGVTVVGVPHEGLGQVVAAVLADAADVHAAHRAAAALAPAQRPRRWYHVASPPVAASGKVDRTALRELLAGPAGRAARVVPQELP